MLSPDDQRSRPLVVRRENAGCKNFIIGFTLQNWRSLHLHLHSLATPTVPLRKRPNASHHTDEHTHTHMNEHTCGVLPVPLSACWALRVEAVVLGSWDCCCFGSAPRGWMLDRVIFLEPASVAHVVDSLIKASWENWAGLRLFFPLLHLYFPKQEVTCLPPGFCLHS